jgi:signal transduction histidine kinase
MARERGLELSGMKTGVWVESDPQLLRRILQNFLSNAVRYTERGRIVIGCRRQGERILAGVWDTGPGIPAKAQRLIFEEFRRLDKDRHAPGLGLGLAIAERMARLLDHPADHCQRTRPRHLLRRQRAARCPAGRPAGPPAPARKA